MQKRKSHTKSRNGCRNCKKRHVKCDEQGPPCFQCILRKEPGTCALPILRNAAAPAALAPSTARLNPSPARLSPSSASLSPSPSSFLSTPDSNRLLELELMHRWSTRSWTCQASTPECRPYLLDQLPRAALRNSYLLNAIFTTAALDLALSYAKNKSSSDSRTYFRAAREYEIKATADFRAQITSLTRENIDLVFYFSSLVGVASFAMPANKGISIIDRVCDYVDMTLCSTRMAFENIDWLRASRSPLSTVLRDYSINLDFLDALDPETKTALALLTSVSRQVRISATSPALRAGAVLTGEASPEAPCEGQLEAVAEGPFAGSVYIYQLAIGQMKYCFAEDLQARLKGYFHAVFAVTGTFFVSALRSREPMAVFIFMYWGVLVHRASKDPALWAIVSEGQDVVSEASELLLRSEIVAIPGVREGIAWTRSQVNLPALPGCPLPAELAGSRIMDDVDTRESLEVWRKALEV